MQPCRDEPGMEFDYISGSTQIMAEVLEAAYGRAAWMNWCARRSGGRSAASTTAYGGARTREDGDFKAFCCLYATARDFGRIGQLYLDSGMWKGQQLIDRGVLEASITPANLMIKGTPNQRYGYFWWLAEVDGQPIHGIAAVSTVSTWWWSRTRTSCWCAPA
jgi:CubicO group peptidase (beta-lactamase class C family)